jgi:glutaredoxin 3
MRKFLLYTRSSCPYCHAATRLISENGHGYEVTSTDNQPELLVEAIGRHQPGWKTVPLIIELMSDGAQHFVGGYDDLREYLKSGKQLLKG